jgi:hypothetical protein
MKLKKILFYRIPTPLDKKIIILEEFTKDIINYEKNNSLESRRVISKKLPLISDIMSNQGISPIIRHASAPAFGGKITIINLLDNVFYLSSYDMNQKDLVHFIDMTIGRLKQKANSYYYNIINPIFWVKKIILIPFSIIRFAGFEGEKVEFSFLGKMYKLLAGLTSLIASLVAIYQFIVNSFN